MAAGRRQRRAPVRAGDAFAPRVAHAGKLRQAGGDGLARLRARRRIGDRAVRPLPRRRRQSQGTLRPSRSHAGTAARWWRHAALAAFDRHPEGAAAAIGGKRLSAADALAAGILNAIVPIGTQVDAARAWLLLAMTTETKQPWDIKGYKVPGGAMASPAMQQVVMAANAMVRAKTYGNYPAPRAILSCVYEGMITDIDTGLTTEARYFVHTVLTPEAKAMIRTLFFSMNEANKLAARPRNVPVQRYSKIGVIGAGMMGAGIAYVAAKAGLQVALIDQSQPAAD